MLIKEEFEEGVETVQDLIERDMSLGKYNTGRNKSNTFFFLEGGEGIITVCSCWNNSLQQTTNML